MQEEKNKKNNEEKALTPAKEGKKTWGVKKIFHRKRTYYKTHHNQEQKVAQDLTKILGKSIKTMIPWLLIPTILFSIGAYYVFDVVVFSYYTPLWFKIVFGIINFSFFILVGLVYGLFMGFVASLKLFSQSFSSLLRQAMNSLKSSIENKINNLSFEMFSKKELSALINQTFSDFGNNIKKYAQKTALGFVAVGIITSILFFARHFIVRSLGIIKNKADAFALISARTSLVVAIVLNLTLFTKIILWLGTFLGIGILLLQALFVLYMR